MQNSFFTKLKNTIFPETWCCAVRFNDDSSTSILNDKTTPFKVIEDTKRYWTADPFLFEKDGKLYLFFEAFDRLKRKGLLGYREISNGEYGDIKIFYESESHLSYPYIYEDNGEIYIIPESNKSNELFRLKCESFPDKWVKEKVLLNEKLADTTRFALDTNIYYFTEKVDDSNVFNRLDLYYEENSELIEFDNNPVKTDASSARCAGKVFNFGDYYIRPSQNCGVSYGENLNFNRIINIDKNDYSEEAIQTVSHSHLVYDVIKPYTGIHTYNKLDNVEVIDLKIRRKFTFFNMIGIIRKKLKI